MIADGTTILMYKVTYTYDGQTIENNTSQTRYSFKDLIPNSRVEISISAVTACGVIGPKRSVNVWTKKIRECKNLLYFFSKNRESKIVPIPAI